MFTLDPRIIQDSLPVTKLELSEVRLMNDQRYSWLLLIPQRENVQEIIDLNDADQFLLLQEIKAVSNLIKAVWKAHKLNIAALGNIVPQLHIHIIGRFMEDDAWPHPVWGIGTPQKYLASQADILIMQMQQYFDQTRKMNLDLN